MLKRIISMLLCVVMVISVVPVQAFAADDVTDPTETVTEPTEGGSVPTDPVTEPTEEESAPTEPATEPSVETAAPSEPTVVVPETIESVSKEPAMSESTAGTVVNSGTCGEDLRWTLDKDGNLRIEGTGEMYHYSVDYDEESGEILSFTSPWMLDTNVKVKSVYIGDGVTTIGNHAFSHCDQLTEVYIPDSVTFISYFAFSYCSSLEEIKLPDSVNYIGMGAFSGCKALKSISIPPNVTQIDDSTFYDCQSLKTIIFNGDAPIFGGLDYPLFYGVNATAYYPSDNKTWYDHYGMDPKQNYGGNITWVPYTPGEEPDDSYSGTCGENLTWTYAGGVLTISGSGDMYDFTPAYAENPAPWTECYDVQTIVIEEGVTSIGDHAFEEFSFAEITLPEGLLSIGEDALPSYLVTLHLPASLTSFGDNWLFSLEEISVAEGSASFVVKDGVLFSKDMTRLVKMPSCLADDDDFFEYIVPNTVVEICSGALERCDFIDSLVLPDSLEVIGDKAVSCYGTGVPYGPETITIPKDVKSIGSEALIGVKLIIFMGDAPVIAEDAFSQYAKLAYYPSNNSTWTSDKLQNYGGDLYWVATNGDVPMSGSLTESINWEYDEETGTLTISGDGVMPGYSYSYLPNDFIPPWHHHATKIKTLVIEDGIIEIGYSLFMNYRSLETVTLPSTLRMIGDYAFVGCNALKTVDMGEGVTNIGLCAFMDCSALTNIVIPETMDSIGEMAFCRCASLSDVFFTGNAPVIGLDIFCEVTASAHYPADNPTWTSDVMQDYAGTITWVAVDAEEPDDSYSGTCGDNIRWTLDIDGNLRIEGTGEMEFYTAVYDETSQEDPNPDTVNEGPNTDVLYYTTPWLNIDGIKIKSVYISDGVTSIGSHAFSTCDQLTEVRIPNTVTYIGMAAFSYCTSLEEIDIPDSVTIIDNSVFYECHNLKRISIPAHVANIADYAFYNCKSLREITFCGDAPDFFMGTPQLFYGVTATAYYPANNPTWTADVMQDYGGTITWIVSGSEEPEIVASGTCGEDVIWTLDSKGTLTLSGTGATYDYSSGPAPWYTSYRTAIKSVIIEEGITRIGSYLFDTCSSMTSVVIPESVTEIGNLAFWYCRSLTSVEVPDSVKSIYSGAFLGCEALESIRIGKVDLLGDDVFNDCTSLREITFTWDAPEFGDRVFTNVTADVFYPGENYTWTEDIMQDYGGTITWIAYDPCPDGHTYQDGICTVCGKLENPIIDGGKTENTSWYITEDGTLTISGTGPMSGCGNIKRPWMDYELDVKKVIIEEGITTIGVYAFYQFHNLEEIVIPSTVNRIYELAFNWCKNLKSITLPESLQSIDSCGISYCKSLERITIPSTVTYMGVGALAGCENIKEIQFLGDAPQIGEPPPYVGDPMQDITASAYYPANNTTWTSDVMEKMGGNITWIPYGAVENRVILDAADLVGQTSVWVDGVEYAVQTDGDDCYVDLPDGNAKIMTAYTYHIGDASDIHTQYPVSMKVWTLSNEDGLYTATRVEELDDILQYSGASIRVTGKKGIRMITSVNQAKKNDLISDGLAGYTLKEYGTVVAWASQLGNKPLVLGKSYAKSNYAYKKDVADPVFAYIGDLMQYTNVLVGFTTSQCKNDLVMRPYMILEDADGNEITLYGGTVTRSIGYIAYQNRAAFTPGTEAYKYVWDIIQSVYGNAYDAEYVA